MKTFNSYLDIAKYLMKLEKQTFKLAKKQKIMVSDKKEHDLLTNYDTFMEKYLIENLNRTFPDAGVVSEEYNPTAKGKGTYFVIDPVDGTVNFANKIYDRWGIQIAYVENDSISASAILIPSMGEYIAGRGEGAFKNGKPLHVEVKDFKHSLFAFDCEDEENFNLIRMFRKEYLSWRKTGCACVDHVFTAEGIYGLYIYNRCKLWDWTPGILLLTEAGCVTADYKNLHVMANNQEILDKATKILKKSYKQTKN